MAEGTAPARRWRRLALVVLLIALAARLAIVLHMKGAGDFADTLEYDHSARSILAGRGPGTDVPRAPLYPAFMALGFTIGGLGNYLAVRLLQLLPGLAIVVLTGWLAVRASRANAAQAGAFALAAAAISPMLVFTTGMLYPTALYTALLLLATALALRLDRCPRPLEGALLGVVVGLVWLTDQIALVPVAGLVLWLAARLAPRGWRALATPAVTLLVAAGGMWGWVRWNEAHYGTSGLYFAKAQYVLHLGRNDPEYNGGRRIQDHAPFEALPMDRLVRREWALFRSRSGDYVHDYVWEFGHFFQPMPDRIQSVNPYTGLGVRRVGAAYIAPLLALAVVGLAFGDSNPGVRCLLALPPLLTAFIYSFFITQARYRVPVEPQLIALAALGWARLRRAWERLS